MPDALPSEGLPGPSLLGMCGGDFVEVYAAPENAGRFDCVATCFFMDTAHNIIAYMQTIRNTLKVTLLSDLVNPTLVSTPMQIIRRKLEVHSFGCCWSSCGACPSTHWFPKVLLLGCDGGVLQCVKPAGSCEAP